MTEPDVNSLPNMPYFEPKAVDCAISFNIDQRKGCQQIPVNPADMQKTTVTTPFSLFEDALRPHEHRDVLTAARGLGHQGL
jgi:hypothetical protein